MTTDGLVDRLVALMNEHGIVNAYELEKKMQARFGRGTASRQTIERILQGTTEHPRRETVQQFDDFFELEGALLAELASDPPSRSKRPRRGQRFVGTWFEHIPAQANRQYETVDRIELEQRGDSDGECSVSVSRLFSTREPNDTGQQWYGAGVVRDNRYLLLYFVSVSDDRPDSNGVIAVKRGDTYRRLDGFYVRFRDDADRDDRTPPVFQLNWYRDANDIESSVFELSEDET